MDVHDQTGDLNGQTLYRLLKLYPPPDYVKAAGFDEVRGNGERMADSAYADPLRLQFPVHTKAAAWTSTLFWLHNREQMDVPYATEVEARLDRAAALHGIKAACNQLKQAWDARAAAESSPPEESDADYAFVVERPTGGTERHLPIRDGIEVKEAAAYLERWIDRLGPYADRRQAARRVLDKAAALGVSLDNRDFLDRQAGYGACEPSEAAALLWDRVRRVADMTHPTALQRQLAKTAAACLTTKHACESEQLGQLAELVYQFDAAHGITRYEGGLRRPEDVLFSRTVKAAQAYMDDHVRLTSGAVYRLTDLRRLKLADVRDVFGEGLADDLGDGLTVSMRKAAEVLPHLPRNDAGLLEQLLDAAGITPVEKRAEADPPRPAAFWRELAAQRR